MLILDAQTQRTLYEKADAQSEGAGPDEGVWAALCTAALQDFPRGQPAAGDGGPPPKWPARLSHRLGGERAQVGLPSAQRRRGGLSPGPASSGCGSAPRRRSYYWVSRRW